MTFKGGVRVNSALCDSESAPTAFVMDALLFLSKEGTQIEFVRSRQAFLLSSAWPYWLTSLLRDQLHPKLGHTRDCCSGQYLNLWQKSKPQILEGQGRWGGESKNQHLQIPIRSAHGIKDPHENQLIKANLASSLIIVVRFILLVI